MQLNNNFEDLAQKMHKESSNLKSLETFFKEYTKLCDNSATSLLKLLVYLQTQSNATFSLQEALQAFTKQLGEFAEEVQGQSGNMRLNVVGPLEKFRGYFDKESTNFVKSGKNLLEELAESRKRAEESKAAYVKSAVQLEKVECDLNKVQESPQESSSYKNALIDANCM